MTVVAMSHGELCRYDTLLRVERGELRVEDAATLLRLGRRQIFRLLGRLHAEGAAGLVSRERGKPSNRRYTSTAGGKAILDMLGVFAEFETNLRKERQLEGIAAAKAQGVYAGKGGLPTIDPLEVRLLHSEGVGPAAIAKQLKIGRASVYRLLGRPEAAERG